MQNRNYRYAPVFSAPESVRRGNNMQDARPNCQGLYPDSEGCGGVREPMVLAMAYVLSQPFENLYTPGDALKAGTVFMDLNLPYGGRLC